ncbi:MAG TPA: hypothetical protein VMV49_05055 [Candidatus Deferrimicrobium sp.]|nr:hypothetical protein [Candidatus Deferrimicrobium sp.]
MANIESIISQLWSINETISAITILSVSNNSIIYQSDNWDVSPDLQNILGAWNGQGASIEVQGIRYSTLQCTPERLVCTNVRGQGHIVGAKEGSVMGIAYLLPDASVGASYMDVARVVGEISKL